MCGIKKALYPSEKTLRPDVEAPQRMPMIIVTINNGKRRGGEEEIQGGGWRDSIVNKELVLYLSYPGSVSVIPYPKSTFTSKSNSKLP